MEMGLVKVCEFLTTTVIPLMLLVDFSVDCQSEEAVERWKKLYCQHPILVRGNFLNITEIQRMPANGRYKITQVIKGDKNMKTDVIIDGQNCNSFITPDLAQDYFVIGEAFDGETIRLYCQRSHWWKNLSEDRKKALAQIESNGCQ